MRKSNVKKNAKIRMVEAAFTLFHEKGVHATSIDAVLERSRTGKSQFSHYFKTKEGLVLAVLRHFSEQLKTGAYDPVKSIESWEDLEHWMRSFIQWQETMECTLSCPIGTIGHDLSEDQKELRREIREIFNWRRNFIARFFKEQQHKGAMQKNVHPEALADFCYTITQGGLWMAKIERSTKPFENAVDNALSYLHSLRLPTKKTASRA